MNNLKIKTKLLLLFIVIKIIPLLILSYIAIEGAMALSNYFENTTKSTFTNSKNIIKNTAQSSIEDSIKELDSKSQISLERLTYEVANNIAAFLYERDKDLLFLSQLSLNEEILENFYNIKTSPISVHGEYIYDDIQNIWRLKDTVTKDVAKIKASLKDNEKEFNINQKENIVYKNIPIYKEIQVIGLDGREKYKASSINKKKIDVSHKEETYCKAEDYFTKIQKLKKGEIYVSQVIGEYVGSKIIGTFTKEKAQKAHIEFEPEKYGYAGKENPVGKRFDGIIRFVTPIYKNGVKTGYVAFALDHRHIMEFSDSCNPLQNKPKQDISDASSGNYAFIWDYKGKNISHARDYFIVGYDKHTGEKVPGWLSNDVAKKFEESKETDLNTFLQTYPQFEEQSLQKKPNIEQIKKGQIGLDCRYLNFAPQCKGWMELTQNGGYGSFVLFWSNVWKLTTAATIPYYTGQYGSSKRGFGFVTMGANVDEFHAAATRTKDKIDIVMKNQIENMKKEIDENRNSIEKYISNIIQDLTVITFIMIVIVIIIAIWMSNVITEKIEKLLIGTKEYAKHNFNYKIDITSNDEIGKLEKSFNDMAYEIKTLIDKQKSYSTLLEIKAKEAEEALAVKSNFLASVSHEIRTPLNSILGFLQLLQEKHLDKESANYLKIMESSGQNLLAMVSDILDFSKVENDKIELVYEKINPYEKFVQIAKSFDANTKNKNIQFNINIDQHLSKCIQLDIFRTSQVLNNLLSNAIKFTPKNGIISFSIEYREKNHEIFVCIEDNGIGISLENQKKVFEPFSQEDSSTTREYGGTGLGLAISSKLINLMGGELKLESQKGKGSKFYFVIPLKECNSCIIPQTNNLTLKPILETNQFKLKKILLVEDDKTNQMFMEILLKKLGLDFDIANDGVEAIEKFKKEKYACILMDENMPKMNGVEATKRIIEYEKEHELVHTPIVAVTANALKNDRERFLSVGMDEYITKPVDKEKLNLILLNFLK